MIAVYGDEKVDLKNSQLYQKASHSIPPPPPPLPLRSGRVKRPNISRNTRQNCNFSLPFKNLPLKLHVIQTPLQKVGRNSLYEVFNISYFSPFTSNISGQQCMGLEIALTWKTCTFGVTKKLSCADSFIYKNLLNYTAIFGSFSIPNEQR